MYHSRRLGEMVDVHEQNPGIARLPGIIALGLAIPLSLWGLFAAGWAGKGESAAPIALWLLPALAVPLMLLRFVWAKMPLAIFWFITLIQFVWGAWINWQACQLGRCTTTNPLAIAASGVFFPPVWGWALIAVTLQLRFKRRN
jgi:hypothetical protein